MSHIECQSLLTVSFSASHPSRIESGQGSEVKAGKKLSHLAGLSSLIYLILL
jgi:hypothetical protein